MYAKIKKGWLEPDIFIYSVCVGGGGEGKGCAKTLSTGAEGNEHTKLTR